MDCGLQGAIRNPIPSERKYMQPRLKLERIRKAFPGVLAVQDVTLEAMPGEILALVGENGAGKSTLMNILSGAIRADQGKILLDGTEVEIDSPRRALELGITMIHQELALIPQMSVGQNIFLGREPRLPGMRWMVDWKRLYQDAQRELDRLGMDLSARVIIQDLTIAQRQMVEIAKALSYHARLIVLDEPTSALSERETVRLFDLMRSLRAEGVTLIFISHRLEEVFNIADRIAVMRDGQLVGVKPAQEVSRDEVVQMMVGRELKEFFPKSETQRGDLVLSARDLRRGKVLKGVDLDLYRGEIVGLAGLVGSGRSELARALFGVDRLEGGTIKIEGKPVQFQHPQDAIRFGIGLVPEDRKAQGLFLGQSVRSNVVISMLQQLSQWGFIRFWRVEEIVQEMVRQLNIRTPSHRQKVRNLSGGNQQKVVIARWMSLNPKILILDEPSRGVDVAAKAEIHALISQLAVQGVAVLMISSELPEILGVSDRILVMREGKIVAEFERGDATQENIMREATGQDQSRGRIVLQAQGA
jgi:ribose transport system ATP-binding protein